MNKHDALCKGTNAMSHAVNRFSIVLQLRRALRACALEACPQKETAELRELQTEQSVYSLNGRKDAFLRFMWSSFLLSKFTVDVCLRVLIHKFTRK